VALGVCFESVVLIFFEERLIEDSAEIAFGYFFQAINVGAFYGKIIVENVGFEALTHAVNMEEMSTAVQTLKLVIVETAVAYFAEHFFLLVVVVFVHLLL
jgi:hypothetical protein